MLEHLKGGQRAYGRGKGSVWQGVPDLVKPHSSL